MIVHDCWAYRPAMDASVNPCGDGTGTLTLRVPGTTEEIHLTLNDEQFRVIERTINRWLDQRVAEQMTAVGKSATAPVGAGPLLP